MTFTPEQERRLVELMDERLRSTRHENADHLDKALLPVKIAPRNTPAATATDNQTLQVVSGVAKWNNSYGVQAGFGTLTSDSAGAGDKISFSIIGDGVTPVAVYGRFAIASTTAGANVYVDLRDGAGGTGTLLGRGIGGEAAANLAFDVYFPGWVVPAWSGSKTLYARLDNTAGTPTMYGATTKAWMRAIWAPGNTAS